MIDLIERGQRVAQQLQGQKSTNPKVNNQGGYSGQSAPSAPPPDHAGVSSWLNWIAGQLPLLPSDKKYVHSKLSGLPRTAISKTAKRYVQIWLKHAGAEEKGHQKQNAGRTAANRSLLQLVG